MNRLPNPEGKPALILVGPHAGQEGICVGPIPERPGLYAVSPTESDEILQLRFPEEFGVLVGGNAESPSADRG